MALRLVKAEPAHVMPWRRWRTDPEALRYMYLPAAGLDEWEAKLATARSDFGDRSGELYRWIAVDGDQPVGSLSFSNPDWGNLHAEIGYLVAPEARGKGVGRRMVAAALDLAFGDGGLERVMAFIHAGNVGSIRLAESLGFVREGLLREHNVIQGCRCDHYLYAILKREWRGAGPRPG
jgi:ribosomal-protein-alanine N-acetyltransferase